MLKTGVKREVRIEEIKQNVKNELARLLVYLTADQIRNWLKNYIKKGE